VNNTLALHQQRYRRGRILQVLAASNDQGASESMLRTTIREWGYKVDADTFELDLWWLASHGMVSRRTVVDVGFAKITQLGRDIVSHDADVPGVVVMED
jgi:hypothetical protein